MYEHARTVEQQRAGVEPLCRQACVEGEIIKDILQRAAHSTPHAPVDGIPRCGALERLNRARFEDCFPEVVQVVAKGHPDVEWPWLTSLLIVRHIYLSSLSLPIPRGSKSPGTGRPKDKTRVSAGQPGSFADPGGLFGSALRLKCGLTHQIVSVPTWPSSAQAGTAL